jgi:hypothetical protein
MYVTARQLEQMLRDSGTIVLPAGARLTPGAQDLVRAKKLELSYDASAGKPQVQLTSTTSPLAASPSPSGASFVYWCGAKSGTAKAAISMTAREVNLRELPVGGDANNAIAAVRSTIEAIKNKSAVGAILVVEHASIVSTLANRSPHLRAIVGTSIGAIDLGLSQLGANVLILEPGNLPLMTIRNLITKFIRSPRGMNEELAKALGELSKA